MGLVRLVSPDSDPEIIAIVAMLEAHGIYAFVRGGGFGGLYPGVQINGFNTRDIMVRSCVRSRLWIQWVDATPRL